VISEAAVAPTASEFVEIYNPTNAEVNLGNYFLSDIATYYEIANGTPADLGQQSDFLVQFPNDARLAAHGVLTIAPDPAGYLTAFGSCPDFAFAAAAVTCGTGSARAMVIPSNGGVGTSAALLTNTGEPLMLFTWDGVQGHTVKDVDYVVWGASASTGNYVNKTGVTGYAADTDIAAQRPIAAPGNGQSIERCQLDTGERTTGGNGADGHDTTSERFDISFTVQTTPTPRQRNACLP
jgi:hypothetical protein